MEPQRRYSSIINLYVKYLRVVISVTAILFRENLDFRFTCKMRMMKNVAEELER